MIIPKQSEDTEATIKFPSFKKKMFCLECLREYTPKNKINNFEIKEYYCPYCKHKTLNLVIGILKKKEKK